MSRKVASKDDFQTRLTGVSEWQTATRDDALVAGESNATRSMDRVYALNTASFFDELFHYIREIGAWPLLVGMDPQDRKGALYPFIQFVLVTIMRCVGGGATSIKSIWVFPLTSRFRQHLTSQTIRAPPALCLIFSGILVCFTGSTPNLNMLQTR